MLGLRLCYPLFSLALALGACASSPQPKPRSHRMALPASIDELECPLTARKPLPERPPLSGVIGLANEGFAGCFGECGDTEGVIALLSIAPDGTIDKPTFVAPVEGCFAQPAVQQCVAAVWSKLCFLPSERGIDNMELYIAAHPKRSSPHSDVFGGPIPLRRVAPRYPVEAARKSMSGQVRLRYDVGPDGAVHNVEVLQSEPSGVFDDAAKEAIREWRFDPAVDRQGRPVWARGQTLQMPFRMGRRAPE